MRTRPRRVRAPYIRYGPAAAAALVQGGQEGVDMGTQGAAAQGQHVQKCVKQHVLLPLLPSKGARHEERESSDSDESVKLFVRQGSPDSEMSICESLEDHEEEDEDENGQNNNDYECQGDGVASQDVHDRTTDQMPNIMNQKGKKYEKTQKNEKNKGNPKNRKSTNSNNISAASASLATLTSNGSTAAPTSASSFLPVELTELIAFFADPQDLPSLALVSSAWHSGAMRELYRRPVLNSNNYRKFVETLSVRDSLGTYVKELDLSNIIQSGRNSYTSRILRKCRHSLEVFIAPQTSFGYAPLLSIKQCKRLRILDLGLVSEMVDLRQLFVAVENARRLERLEFPRSSMFCEHFDEIVWPKRLKYLGLAGGISNEFVQDVGLPDPMRRTLTHLSINNCPLVSGESVRLICGRLGEHLRSVSVTYPMPVMRANSMDSILRLCPKLQTLTVSVDYISRHMFDRANLPLPERSHPLRCLTLDSSGMLGQSGKIDADDIALAILDNKIPRLKYVRVTRKLGWNPENEDTCELIQVLEEKEGGGVWMF